MAELERLGLMGNVSYTEAPGDATRIAREFVLADNNEPALVYACGGDGTVNEVISGVYDLENCSVAPVPVGSGNDFIRSFTDDPASFLDIEALQNGRDVEIDLLRCNDKISDNSVTVGYDCAVAKNVDKFKKWKLISSSFAYKLSIFYCLFTKRRHNFTIKADGETLSHEGTYLLSVSAKGKFYGGGIKCAPRADHGDGLIDFMAIDTVGVLKFVSLLPSFIKGKHLDNPKIDFIRHNKYKTVTYTADEPFEIGIDGEILTVDKAEISVLPKAVKIRVPMKKESAQN